MGTNAPFQFDSRQEYPRLSRAPIVEAVIHWHAQPSIPYDADRMRNELKGRFSEYELPVQRDLAEWGGMPGDSSGALERMSKQGGIRLEHRDQPWVVQFKPTGVVFSRLEPYDSWESFEQECLRFWNAYSELARPEGIDHLGVRFINRIPFLRDTKASTVLRFRTETPSDFPFPVESYFHQNVLSVPGSSYKVEFNQSIPSEALVPASNRALLLDIDVGTGELPDWTEASIRNHLQRMRQIKNEVFFTSLSSTGLEALGAST